MLSQSTSSTPLRPWGSTSYSLLNGFVTPFQHQSPSLAIPVDMPLQDYRKLSLSGLYMRTAVTPGRSVVHLTSLDAIQQIRAYYSFPSQLLIWIALLTITFLTFFEDGPSQISSSVTLSIEFLCLAILLWKTYHKKLFTGDKAFATDTASIIHLCLLVILMLDFFIGIFPRKQITLSPDDQPLVYNGSDQGQIFRYGRALRPFLIMYHAPSIRHRLVDLLVAGWRARTTMVLVAFNVIFFAVVATILFRSTKAQPGSEQFMDLKSSLITLIILQTTSNSPDVFVPFYYETRWTSLFFISFLLMSHFLLLNLMLGVVYHENTRRLRMAASNELLESCVSARSTNGVLSQILL
jgi:hypothetical protein